MDDLYRQNILDHYHNPHNFGTMDDPDASYEQYNPFCGDKITMQIRIKNQESGIKNLTEVKFHGEGCAISLASASMLTDEVAGKSVEEVMEMTPDDITNMLGIELTPTRLKCALLPLEVLQKTLALVKKS